MEKKINILKKYPIVKCGMKHFQLSCSLEIKNGKSRKEKREKRKEKREKRKEKSEKWKMKDKTVINLVTRTASKKKTKAEKPFI
jgi:hypothetical protein